MFCGKTLQPYESCMRSPRDCPLHEKDQRLLLDKLWLHNLAPTKSWRKADVLSETDILWSRMIRWVAAVVVE
jgi:rhamnogalacturonyl hydrolase YesR